MRSQNAERGALRLRVVPHRARNCEQNTGRNALATAFCSRTIMGRKSVEIIRETRMASRLEAYSVVAYNTAKLSENKMHDDQVARRFGFSGAVVFDLGFHRNGCCGGARAGECDVLSTRQMAGNGAARMGRRCRSRI